VHKFDIFEEHRPGHEKSRSNSAARELSKAANKTYTCRGILSGK